jgi:uncharacterized protein (TIRG00374 family)
MNISSSNASSKHRIKVWATYLVAAAALVWVFYDIEWRTILDQVQQLSWGWVCVIVALDVLSFYVQGVRWQILLRPCGWLSYMKTTQAIYVGLFTSEVLPLRAGEVIRGLLVSRWLSRKFVEVLPSIALERLFDGFWFSSAMIITALLIPVPGQIRIATNVLLATSVVGILALLWIVFRTDPTLSHDDSLRKTLWKKMSHATHDVRVGLQQIGFRKGFWTAAGVSGVLHLVQGLAFLSILRACAIDLPLLPSIAVFLVVHLGIAIPNAPANVGTFQLFCVLALTFFGVEKSAAAAFSVVAFAILTIPVLLIGVAATLYAGLSLTGFHAQLRDPAASQPAPEGAA